MKTMKMMMTLIAVVGLVLALAPAAQAAAVNVGAGLTANTVADLGTTGDIVTFDVGGGILSLENDTGTDFVRDVSTPATPAIINVGANGAPIAAQVHELGNVNTSGGNTVMTVTGSEGYGLTLGAIAVGKNWTIENDSDGLLTITSIALGNNRNINIRGTGEGSVTVTGNIGSGQGNASGASHQLHISEGMALTVGGVIDRRVIKLLKGTLTMNGSTVIDITGDGTGLYTFTTLAGDGGDDETLNLNGSFVFDVTGAIEAEGNTWQVVDNATIFAVNYDAGFTVTGATSVGSAGSRVWTFAAATEGLGYEFDESTGALTLVVPPAGTLIYVK